MVLTFDIFAAKYGVWHVDNARDYVLEVRSKTQNNQLIGSQIINAPDIRKLNGKLVYDFKDAQKVPIVRPEEELSISFKFYSDYKKRSICELRQQLPTANGAGTEKTGSTESKPSG